MKQSRPYQTLTTRNFGFDNLPDRDTHARGDSSMICPLFDGVNGGGDGKMFHAPRLVHLSGRGFLLVENKIGHEQRNKRPLMMSPSLTKLPMAKASPSDQSASRSSVIFLRAANTLSMPL